MDSQPKYNYSFCARSWMHDTASDQLGEFFDMIASTRYEIAMTETEFNGFVADMAAEGFELHEIERVPHFAPEVVITDPQYVAADDDPLGGHVGFGIETPDGHTAHILGDPNMDQKTRDALAAIVDAAHRMTAAEWAAFNQPKEDGPDAR